MGLESATYVNDLDASNPVFNDVVRQGDDHIRLMKAALKTTFPNADRAWRMPEFATKTLTGSVATTDENKTLLCDTSGGAITLTLPTPTFDGWSVVVVKTTADANAVVVAPPSGSILTAFGSAASISLTAPYAKLELFWTGSNFIVMDRASSWSTGDVKLTLKTSADFGWIMCDDGTIGSAGSGASNLASANAAALYALIWTNVSDTYAPVTGGRGASAAADFAANKKMALTKMLGRALGVGGAGSGLTSRALGQTVGEENHTLTQAELPAFKPPITITDPGHGHNLSGQGIISDTGGAQLASGSSRNYNTGVQVPTNTTGITAAFTNNLGSGDSHNTMQPTSFLNAMIKL